MTRVAIMKTKKGHTVHSYDFTENIFQVFEGSTSFQEAVDYCTFHRYSLVNIKHFRRSKNDVRRKNNHGSIYLFDDD